ncbi:hypothetical protein WJX84_008150 [Apatococcus fuscideae]|uniref:Uncharacterized protein n=1 Tax=Apatococcus fuscideae TaxID=2026836 RepID=A0AAW1TC52_9CHLO
MPYIKNGQVVQNKDWSFASVQDMLRGLYNEVIFFFQTLVSPNAALSGTQSAAQRRINQGGAGNGRPPGAAGGASRVAGMDTLSKRTVSTAACGGGG